MAEEKTNVMRTLEQKKVPYTAHCYVETGETNGVKVAALVHGGCSPIGMKKFFRTTLDESAKACPTIYVSAGKIGYQIQLAPADLARVIRFDYADLCVK